jgi:hypothetical protein
MLEAVLGTSDPTNAVVGVELDTGAALLLADQLQTVVVNKHVGRTALKLVGRHGLLDGLDSGGNDSIKALLVNGALNSDVRQDRGAQTRRGTCGVELGVDGELADGTEDLGQATNDDLAEEEGEEDLDREQSDEAQTDPVPVDRNLDGQLTEGRAEPNSDEQQGEGDKPGVLEVDWPLLGFDLAALLVQLRIRLLFLLRLLILVLLHTRLPNQLHQLSLDCLGTVHQMHSIIIPDNEQSL